MEIYFSLMLFSLFTAIIFRIHLRDKKKIYILLNLFPMMSIACLRSNTVGTDLSMYIDIYSHTVENFDYFVNVLNLELGYMILAYIVNYFTFGSQTTFLIIIAIITYGLILYSFKNVSKNIVVSLLIFQGMGMYCTTFNLMKQYVAVSIVSVCYVLLLKNKFYFSIALCIVGSFFHRSCSVFLLFIFLYLLLKNYTRYYLFMAIVAVGSIIFISEYQTFISFIPKYNAAYVDSFYGSSRTISASVFLGVFAIVYLIFDNVKTKYEGLDFDKVKAFNNILIFVYGLVWILSYRIFIIHRLAPYFEIMLCFAIPYAIEKQKRYKLVSYSGLIIALVCYYYIFLSKNLGNVVPYVTRI